MVDSPEVSYGNRLVSLVTDEIEKSMGEEKVFEVVFAFKNHDLLQVLAQRAHAITEEDWEEVVEQNKKLTKLVKENYTQMTTPLSAFVTMCTEKGKRELYNKAEVNILGHLCRTTKSKAPSDLIWENQEVTVRWSRARKLFLLITTFFVFLKLTNYLVALDLYFQKWERGKYDTTINCQTLSEQYSSEQFEKFATSEMINYSAGQNRKISSIVPCFCA